MIKKLMTSIHPSIERFIEILMEKKFNKRDAQDLLPKINKNYKFENGDTLLDFCLKKNRFKAASWLVKQGIEITRETRSNVSSLRLAVEKGEVVVVDDILQYGNVDINQVDKNGRSLLQDAVIYGYSDIVDILIEQGIDINIKDDKNRNVIFDTVNYGEMKIVDSILAQDDLELNNIDVSGKTVLHQKIVLKNDELAIKLIQNGADPTICDDEGKSFLTYTALRGKEGLEVLHEAIKYGTDLNKKSPRQTSVLSEVLTAFSKTSKLELDRRESLKEVAQTLIEGGADINIKSEDDESILFTLVRNNDFEGVSFILQNEVAINEQNLDKETPLFIACMNGVKALDIVLLLLENGANPLIKNNKNQTILEVLNDIVLYIYKFIELHDPQIAKVIDVDGKYLVILKELLALEEYDFTFLDSQGNPLFFKPFLYGDTNIINLYLQNGFDINQKNADGVNLFYEYVLKSFQNNEPINEFTTKLTFLLVNKSDINIKNNQGQNIFLNITNVKKLNMKLFKKLIQLTKFDHNSTDMQGRTVVHNCILNDNLELFGLIYALDKNIHNKADKYNILPITYAALFGKKDFVFELLRKSSILNSGKKIPETLKEKFRPMIDNLPSLGNNIEDSVLLKQLDMLIDQIKEDFK